MPSVDGIYSQLTYSVDSFNLKYLCNRSSDSHGVFGNGFRTQKVTTLIFGTKRPFYDLPL